MNGQTAELLPDRQSILIVDDEPLTLNYLAQMIGSSFHELTIETTTSSSDALERVGSTAYDAVISDVSMPGLDGLTLLSEIKRTRPEIPVLMTSGGDASQKAMENGALAFIPKPADIGMLLTVLRQALHTRRSSPHLPDGICDRDARTAMIG